ncbi:MAG TPA: hypothetical protein VGG06_13145 [Thermoanaerobaculia bacterium]|jgi:hypothetical protein
MAVKLSEMVTRRVELGKGLKAGIDTAAAELAEGFGTFLNPVVAEGETPPDVHYHVVLIGRSVDHEVLKIVQADRGVLGQVHDSDTVSFDIGELADGVGLKLRAVKHTFRGLYGLDSLKRVGLKGEFPRRPLALYDRGRLVQTSLRNPDMGLQPVLDFTGEEGMVITPAVLANRLEPELTSLGHFVDTRFTDNREDAAMRLLRQRAIAEFDENVKALVRIVQGMFRLAGRPDLAARFRSTLRRLRRRLEQEPVDPGTETDPGTVTEPTTP